MGQITKARVNLPSPPAEDRAPGRLAEVALSIALVTAVFQFLEILPFAPLSVWWLLLALPAIIATPRPRWLPGAALVLASANVVASAWSPIPLEALRMAGNCVALAVSIALTMHVCSSNPDRITRPLAWAAVPIAVQSALTALFFASPELEKRYFDWTFAPYFSGEGVRLLFTSGFNNVVFPEKAGGFFLNGNTASMFMAMVALLYFGIGVRYGRRWMMAFAAVPFLGAIATGSKTALLLAATSILLIILLTAVRRSVIAGFAVAMLLPLAGLFAISALSSAEAFNADTVHTVGSRGRIWDLAVSAILRNPVLGLGYGGWIKFFSREGGFIGFNERPAHNFLLQAWLDGGLVYVSLVAGFALLFVVVGLRALRASRDTRQALAAAAVLTSLIWVFAHGLADNTWIYGEWHSLPFFGVTIATLVIWSRQAREHQSADIEPSLLSKRPDADEERTATRRQVFPPQAGRRILLSDTGEQQSAAKWRCGPGCPFGH